MGKDLKGNDIGKGIYQRKDGTYCYKYQIDGVRQYFYSRDLAYIVSLKESDNKVNFKEIYSNKIIDKTRINKVTKMEKEVALMFPQKQYVYFISDGRYCKIGVAKNVIKRLGQLQTGNSQKLNIIKVIETHVPYLIENALHEFLKSKRINGEWYDILNLLT